MDLTKLPTAVTLAIGQIWLRSSIDFAETAPSCSTCCCFVASLLAGLLCPHSPATAVMLCPATPDGVPPDTALLCLILTSPAGSCLLPQSEPSAMTGRENTTCLDSGHSSTLSQHGRRSDGADV